MSRLAGWQAASHTSPITWALFDRSTARPEARLPRMRLGPRWNWADLSGSRPNLAERSITRYGKLEHSLRSPAAPAGQCRESRSGVPRGDLRVAEEPIVAG